MKKIIIAIVSLLGVLGVAAGLYFGYQLAMNKVYNYNLKGQKLVFCEETDFNLSDYGSLPIKPSFESSDDNIFTVDKKGMVSAKQTGTAILTVRGFNFETSTTVTVQPHTGTIVDCDVRYLCTNCNHKVLVKGGHDFTELTCTEDSYCTICGYVQARTHGHDYKEADCENPETCINCGDTLGEPKGHEWVDAGCTTPPHCSVCNKKGDKSQALGHTYSEPTCTEDSKCIRCDAPGTKKATGHTLADATCTEPKHCTNCDYTEGEALGHKSGKADCSKEVYCTRCNALIAAAGSHNFSKATCTKPKTCTICKKTEGSALGHNKVDATCTRGAYCSRCNATLSGTIDHYYVTSESGSVICAYCGRSKGSSNSSNYNYSNVDISSYAYDILELVNQERAAAGCGALTLDATMCQAANTRAVEIYSYFSHTRPDGRSCFSALSDLGYSYGCAGENIAAGYSSPTSVMNGWMNSEGHKANILTCGFTKLGVGVYSYNGRLYWVQMFAN